MQHSARPAGLWALPCLLIAGFVTSSGQSLSSRSATQPPVERTGEITASSRSSSPADARSFTPSELKLPILRLAISAESLGESSNPVQSTLNLSSPDESISYLPGTGGQDNTLAVWLSETGREAPKKSYELELSSSADLLGAMGLKCVARSVGCGPTKRYLLLANYGDGTLLRNWSAASLAEALSEHVNNAGPTPPTRHAAAPHSLFVELFLRDVYQGCYQLVEESIDKSQTTGLVLRASPYSTVQISTAESAPLNVEDLTPASDGDASSAAIQERVRAAELALPEQSSGEQARSWRSHLDGYAAVDSFLLDEIMGPAHTTRQPKGMLVSRLQDSSLLSLGFVLNFAHSSGNDPFGSLRDPSSPFIETQSAWYSRLFADPSFRSAAKDRWNELTSDGSLTHWLASIAQQSDRIRQGRKNDAERWIANGSPVAANTTQAKRRTRGGCIVSDLGYAPHSVYRCPSQWEGIYEDNDASSHRPTRRKRSCNSDSEGSRQQSRGCRQFQLRERRSRPERS